MSSIDKINSEDKDKLIRRWGIARAETIDL